MQALRPLQQTYFLTWFHQSLGLTSLEVYGKEWCYGATVPAPQ